MPPMPNRRPQLRLIAASPSASPEEAAAIVAALERFMRATAPALASAPAEALGQWRRAALSEGVQRDPATDVPDPWINT